MIDNLKFVVSGDSHTNYIPPGGESMMWVNKFKVLLEGYFPAVTLTNLGIGGVSISSFMPSSYTYAGSTCTISCNPDLTLNIDAVLALNPDFIVVSFSGNQIVAQMTTSEIIFCYTTVIDMLRATGKKFIITSQGPRDRTFTPPVTAQTYYDDSITVNNFLKGYCPNEYADTYEYMYDNINGLRPWSYLVDVGGLHYKDAGQQTYLEAHIKTKAFDNFLNDYKASAKSFSLIKNGNNIKFSGIIRYNNIKTYGSNDNITFSLINTYNTPDEERDFVNVNESFTDTGYLWYKIEIVGKRQTKTITKKLN